MLGECHAHLAMDDVNYARAMTRHANIPDEDHIRACFKAYEQQGVAFVRDGGDAFGVSRAAKPIALEFGIDYRTPVFAIHKEGHYGSIVGRSFSASLQVTPSFGTRSSVSKRSRFSLRPSRSPATPSTSATGTARRCSDRWGPVRPPTTGRRCLCRGRLGRSARS